MSSCPLWTVTARGRELFFEPSKHFDFEALPEYCWFMDELGRRMPDRITSQIILTKTRCQQVPFKLSVAGTKLLAKELKAGPLPGKTELLSPQEQHRIMAPATSSFPETFPWKDP
jgi:hypothetical protein